MISINSIHIENNDKTSRLVFNIDDNSIEKHIWFEVEKEYSEYLNSERADAILIGILSYAMRKNSNIVSKIPVSEDLLFQIREYLIPSISKYDDNLYNIKIDAPIVSEKLNCAGGVGTGISCGIDSLHVLSNFINSEYKSLNLTHLCINNVGSWGCYNNAENEETVRSVRYKKAQEIADKIELKLIKSNSNIAEEIKQSHLCTHTYSSMFAVHCLAKLFKIYYYGSVGSDLSHFSIVNTSKKSPSSYELLSLNCFSTESLRIYLEGATKNKLEKTIAIVDNEIAHKYLHSCLVREKNCGMCFKCKRTLLTLDGLNKLELFKDVFDVDLYKKYYNEYIEWLLGQHYAHSYMQEPIYQLLKNRITIFDRIRYFLHLIFSINHIEDSKHYIFRFLGFKIAKKREIFKGWVKETIIK